MGKALRKCAEGASSLPPRDWKKRPRPTDGEEASVDREERQQQQQGYSARDEARKRRKKGRSRDKDRDNDKDGQHRSDLEVKCRKRGFQVSYAEIWKACPGGELSVRATMRGASKVLMYDVTSVALIYVVSEPRLLSEDAWRTKS